MILLLLVLYCVSPGVETFVPLNVSIGRGAASSVGARGHGARDALPLSYNIFRAAELSRRYGNPGKRSKRLNDTLKAECINMMHQAVILANDSLNTLRPFTTKYWRNASARVASMVEEVWIQGRAAKHLFSRMVYRQRTGTYTPAQRLKDHWQLVQRNADVSALVSQQTYLDHVRQYLNTPIVGWSGDGWLTQHSDTDYYD